MHWGPDGQLSFYTSRKAEYPSGFCVTYAHALGAHLRAITPALAGEYPTLLESLVCTQNFAKNDSFQSGKQVGDDFPFDLEQVELCRYGPTPV